MIASSRPVHALLGCSFRNFAQERRLLERMVCPELQRKCWNRKVEIADLDFRWRITEEEARQSKVVPTRLDEIDRSRRYLNVFMQTERKIDSELLGETPADPPTDALAKYAVSCPHCNSSNEWEVWLNGGLQVFHHCDQVISMLVPTAEGRVASPASLVKAWWPSGVPVPSGSTESKCLAAWSLVALRLDYCYDHHQREGGQECWLPASETWHRSVGDCEDHSILLASMLLHLGIKAWVVWGTVDKWGHAWVEVEIDGVLRLIEATGKQPLPDRLPSVQEAGPVYGFSVYKPDGDYPCRTNGVVYSNFAGDDWQEVSLVGAVAI